jgi:hypothetical protein
MRTMIVNPENFEMVRIDSSQRSGIGEVAASVHLSARAWLINIIKDDFLLKSQKSARMQIAKS